MWDTVLCHFFIRTLQTAVKMTTVSRSFLQYSKCICRNSLKQVPQHTARITMAARQQSYSIISKPKRAWVHFLVPRSRGCDPAGLTTIGLFFLANQAKRLGLVLNYSGYICSTSIPAATWCERLPAIAPGSNSDLLVTLQCKLHSNSRE